MQRARETDVESSAKRIYISMLLLAASGTAVAAVWLGSRSALGFAMGAAFSGLNFWSWHRLVRRIGEPEAEGPRKGSAVVFGTRYILFGLAGYATIQYFEASLFAAFAGCFVAVAAVILEILLELF